MVRHRYWFIPLVAAAVLLVWYLWDGGFGRAPVSGLPLFASMAQFEAYSSPSEAAPPDFAQFAHLGIPPLPPEEALETFTLEEGFRIEIVAYEPDVVDPVAMDIDRDGRLWVVEMSSYMPVHDRSEPETTALERVPLGRIVVLEDTNGDGRMDHRWTFMDGLVLPRAIKVMDYGVLIAEPPNLWFLRDTDGDGIADVREIVYDRYGDISDYNVEHMPNGLMWGMDNWIHSAHNPVESLRYVDSVWVTRAFEPLGQWGMTQDDWGRLYSSHNSRTLTAHLSPYGYSDRHPRFGVDAGIYANVAESETMWPARMTGVNRGYRDTQVREDGTLLHSTATTGPVIYRGDQFGAEYRGNAFVPEPAGNLIKRLVGIDQDPGSIEATARFAYREREFLTSTDERFRPVNLYNSPDGSLYVIDMYRGIFQHARYLTDYLRDYAVEQGLHEPGGVGQFGRIYRIVREDREIDYRTPRLSELSPSELVAYLRHPNGMLRDAAQQLLVQRSPRVAVRALERLVVNPSVEDYARLQALWTLEGFEPNQYPPASLSRIAQRALDDPHPRVRAAAIRVLEPDLRRGTESVITRFGRMAAEESAPYTRLQLLATLGEGRDTATLRAMARILHEEVHDRYFREMALNGAYEREAELLDILAREFNWRPGEHEDRDWVLVRLEWALEEPSIPEVRLTGDELELFERGAQRSLACAVCHAVDGAGIENVAPPLAGSPWVGGDHGALVRITLDGLEGSAREAGRTAAGAMPAHRFMSDEDVAGILTYIRQSWGNAGVPISVEEVAAIRAATDDRREPWTPAELRELQR